MKSIENGVRGGREPVTDTVAALVHAPAWFGVVVSGGGGRVVGWLTSRPGCSRILAEGGIPYGGDALARRLGQSPAAAVSAAVASRLAAGALRRAGRDVPPDRTPIGVACTAALATDRVRRGREQAFLCAASPEAVWSVHLQFRKGAWDRDRQEEVVAAEILELMACAAGVRDPAATAADAGDAVHRTGEVERTGLGRLAAGEFAWVRVAEDGRLVPEGAVSGALLPGSFHPLHPGHLGMAAAAQRLLGMPVTLELSQANADKADVSVAELRRRIEAINGVRPMVVTRAATFLEKARLFPGRCFVMGYDTAARMLSAEYYGGPDGLAAAAEEFVRLDCRFLVAARRMDGTLRTRDALPVPDILADRFRAIPPEQFQEDISSTALRSRTF